MIRKGVEIPHQRDHSGIFDVLELDLALETPAAGFQILIPHLGDV